MNKTVKQWRGVYPPSISKKSAAIIQMFAENAQADIMEMAAFIERVARLNPDAGEIGAGMLKQLVTEARSVLGE